MTVPNEEYTAFFHWLTDVRGADVDTARRLVMALVVRADTTTGRRAKRLYKLYRRGSIPTR
jgi:hypothetical protein